MNSLWRIKIKKTTSLGSGSAEHCALVTTSMRLFSKENYYFRSFLPTTPSAPSRSRTRRARTSSRPCSGYPSPRATPSSSSSRSYHDKAWRNSKPFLRPSMRYVRAMISVSLTNCERRDISGFYHWKHYFCQNSEFFNLI